MTLKRETLKLLEPIIRIENLSKQYRLGVVGTGTLRHDLNRWYHRVRGKEDPYLKVGEPLVTPAKAGAAVGSRQSAVEYVWALKDINLEVMPGEVPGIIGKNGAILGMTKTGCFLVFLRSDVIFNDNG